MNNPISRRDLFKQTGVLAVGMMAPPWLSAITKADLVKTAKGTPIAPDTVLVVCQLSGGNDGLNTVIPFTDKSYYEARPSIAIAESEVHRVSSNLGFHPAMEDLAKLFAAGKVAVINNVGYNNPNRSHFKSMDIWQSASPDGKLKYGWLGRAFDIFAKENELSAIAGIGLSTGKPLALQAHDASIPCFASLNDIQNMVGNADAERMLREIQGSMADDGSGVSVIQKANNTALDAMNTLKDQLAKFSPKQTYENDAFGRGFKQIAQIVATSPQTRVVYFSAGGFDTHSKQADSHSNLLGGFSKAVAAFQAEMEAAGKADKVMVLVFSEFGRRTYENGSAGTDHGKAGPMFLIGKNIKGGFYGGNPDFTELSQGDLIHKIDFRQVYAAALDNWMGADSKVVLGQAFNPMDVIKG